MVSKVHTNLIVKVLDVWCSFNSRNEALFVWEMLWAAWFSPKAFRQIKMAGNVFGFPCNEITVMFVTAVHHYAFFTRFLFLNAKNVWLNEDELIRTFKFPPYGPKLSSHAVIGALEKMKHHLLSDPGCYIKELGRSFLKQSYWTTLLQATFIQRTYEGILLNFG